MKSVTSLVILVNKIEEEHSTVTNKDMKMKKYGLAATFRPISLELITVIEPINFYEEVEILEKFISQIKKYHF